MRSRCRKISLFAWEILLHLGLHFESLGFLFSSPSASRIHDLSSFFFKCDRYFRWVVIRFCVKRFWILDILRVGRYKRFDLNQSSLYRVYPRLVAMSVLSLSGWYRCILLVVNPNQSLNKYYTIRLIPVLGGPIPVVGKVKQGRSVVCLLLKINWRTANCYISEKV